MPKMIRFDTNFSALIQRMADGGLAEVAERGLIEASKVTFLAWLSPIFSLPNYHTSKHNYHAFEP